jgi:spermidine/putrescine transport system permease protein
MNATRSMRRREWLLTLPSLAWLVIFFAAPAAIVIILAFKPADATGGAGAGWTLGNFRELADPQYRELLWRTLRIAGASTAACIALALPVAFSIARAPARWKNPLLLLVIVPFWTNFLIRVFAWKALLQADGPVSSLLDAAHVFDESPALLYNTGAVLLVMIYTQLPFAILPVYAAAERFDFTLLEAARDLGASNLRAFTRVFIPGISRGISAAALMVFVATIGMYVVPDIVGGVDGEMIGNKIAQRAQGDRNLPLASAMAAAMLAGVTVLMIIFWNSTFRWSPRAAPAPAREPRTGTSKAAR